MEGHTKKVLVTGSNGFLGRALCERLRNDGWQVRGAVRRSPAGMVDFQGIEIVSVGDIGPHTDWSDALRDIDVVVHLAARVHVMNDSATDPVAEFRYVNTQGTARLALAAQAAGVRRFVYMSSVKVNGEETNERPFRETDVPSPQDPYAISKWEAEQALQKLAHSTALGVVILRPPLIYGPGVRANFFKLMKIVDWNIPLPLKYIRNTRSMIYLGNMVDAIVACIARQTALGEVFLVSDNETVSTVELITRIARALDKRPRLFSVPKSWLFAVGVVCKKRAAVQRLLGSLAVDSIKIQQTINWKAPFSLDEGLRLTVDWYVKHKADI